MTAMTAMTRPGGTPRPDPLLDCLILAFLVFDGFITAILEVLYLPSYLGTHQFPISIAVAAVLNVALIVLAATVTRRGGLIVLPLPAWLLGLAVCSMSTSGGSVIMTSHEQGRTLLLLVIGLIPAILFLVSRRIRGRARRS